MIDGYTRLQAFRKVVLPQADDRHRRDRDLLPDLRLERIRLRRAADLRHRADRAALHPDHHRRRRAGLAGGRGRDDPVRDPDLRLHHPAAGNTCCAASPSERCANEPKAHNRQIPERPLDLDPPAALPSAAAPGRMLAHASLIGLRRPDADAALRQLRLYTYSFVTMLAGTVLFIIVSQFPE